MNLVERFFADLTEDVIRTGSFGSVVELVRDIKAVHRQPRRTPQAADRAARSASPAWPRSMTAPERMDRKLRTQRGAAVEPVSGR